MFEFGDGGQVLDVKLLKVVEAGEAIRQYFLLDLFVINNQTLVLVTYLDGIVG